jgi:CBS domain-containing protein
LSLGLEVEGVMLLFSKHAMVADSIQGNHATGRSDRCRATRADTPGVKEVVRLNNAGAALPPTPVVRAVQEHIALEARIGGYEAEERSHEQVERVYEAAGRLLGCEPAEIAFVENATRAWDMAFYSFEFGPADRILTCSAEYVSNYVAFLHVAGRTGVSIEVIPDDEDGQVSIEALERMLDERVKLIAITHVPTNGGLVNPAQAIGRAANAAGVPFLLDACQSAGQLRLDVGELGCDLLSLTGRKYLRGPRGTGLLYARREVAQRRHGTARCRRLRAGLGPLLQHRGRTRTAVPRDPRAHVSCRRGRLIEGSPPCDPIGSITGMASRTVTREDALEQTVGEVMIHSPKTLPSDASVADVRRVFEKPNVRTVLLADGGRFAGLVERDGLPADAPGDAPATAYLEPAPATATPQMRMSDAIKLFEARGEPRLVVLDEDGVTLRGLLCGNTTATGFCLR